MKLGNAKRIIVEDFESQYQTLISKIAYIINTYFDQLYSMSLNKIDFDNLYREIVTVTVTVDANGAPTTQTTFSTKVVASPQGSHVVNAYNPKDTSLAPVSCPFVIFTPVSINLFKITKILGLTPGKQYVLKLEIL